MLQFRQNTTGQKKRPPNYLARREQRRLLYLVMSLGLVILVMGEASKPDNWRWLWSGVGGSGAPQAAQAPLRDYDTRVRRGLHPLALDTFIAIRPEESVLASEEQFVPGVNAEYLRKIRDDTPFRADEQQAWFNLFGILDETEETKLRAASIGEVGFVQLYEQPEQYRGRLVTVRGVAKGAFTVKAAKNELGIEDLHQLWIHLEGGPDTPIVIYSLQLPEKFPLSKVDERRFENIHAEVEVTGFFFKNWAYLAANQEILSTPLLVSRIVAWEPPVIEAKEPIKTSTIVLVIVGTAVAGVLLAGLVYVVSERSGRLVLSRTAARFQGESLRSLEDIDLGPDVGESLQKLSKEHEPSELPWPEPDSRSEPQ